MFYKLPDYCVDITVMINQFIINALNDPKSDFGIVPSMLLRELIAKNEHPVVKKLPDKYKVTFMQVPDGKCVLIDRAIIRRYASGQSADDEKFILDNCDIRYWDTGVKPPHRNGKKR
jgi:hypothetical protein